MVNSTFVRRLDGDEVVRIEDALEKINMRIARLGMLLDIRLDSQSAIDAAMAGSEALFASIEHAPVHSVGQQRRQCQKADELQALLVLRCNLMERAFNELGSDIAYRIMSEVEHHLDNAGFVPGADGFELLRKMVALRQGDAEG